MRSPINYWIRIKGEPLPRVAMVTATIARGDCSHRDTTFWTSPARRASSTFDLGPPARWSSPSCALLHPGPQTSGGRWRRLKTPPPLQSEGLKTRRRGQFTYVCSLLRGKGDEADKGTSQKPAGREFCRWSIKDGGGSLYFPADSERIASRKLFI